MGLVGGGIRVKRGALSRKYFYEFVIIFISLISAQLISLMEWGKNYKFSIYLVNVLVIVYLGFYNHWFKNELMAILRKYEERWDSHS